MAERWNAPDLLVVLDKNDRPLRKFIHNIIISIFTPPPFYIYNPL